MPLDKLSGQLVVKTRDQIIEDYKRDHKFRMPDAAVGKNTQPHVDASIVADALLPIYANGTRLADATSILRSTGDDLTQDMIEIGRPRHPAVGGIGYVIIEASSGGGFIPENTELRDPISGDLYVTKGEDVYLPGDLCVVQGATTGPGTNKPAGTRLQWVSPPPGILGTCLVFENSDGSGITGGADEETDDECHAAVRELLSEPAASGNDADVIQFVQKLPGIAIQKCFAWPAVAGSGTYAVGFTMRPSVPGASRLPNAAQIAQVQAAVVAAFPGDDGVMVASGLDQTYAPCIRVRWGTDASNFVDAVPWPPYDATKVVVNGGAAPTATTVRLANCVVAPPVGKSIAFYDSTTRAFRPKRIATATVVAGSTYDLTFDMTGNASDPSFVPSVGAIVSPYSPSMSSLVEPILNYGDRQGPGEMVASFLDPGRRQRRIPEASSTNWPSKVGNDLLDDVFELVGDATLVEPTTPFATTVGTLGLTFYLHRISDLGIFSL